MKKIITLLIMALLLVGSADAQKRTRKKTSGKARTTATTKAKTPAVTPIGEPQMVFDMNNLTNRGQEDYKKALAGDSHSMCDVAARLRCGSNGFPKNKLEALRWYYLAAKQGYRPSSNYYYDDNPYWEIGYAYYFPDVWDNCVKKNYFEAAKWYAKASTLGNNKGADQAKEYLLMLLKYDNITLAQYEIAMKEARATVSPYMAKFIEQKQNGREDERFYGTWTSPRGTFTITRGPYFDLRGAGKFSGEWTSDGKLHVSFGGSDEVTLRYYNGYLYDSDGRMNWRIGD